MSGGTEIEREIRYKIDEEIKNRIINSSCPIEKATQCVDLCMGQYGFDSLEKLGYIIRLRNKSSKCIIESKRRLDDNSWSESKIVIPTMKDGYDFLKNIGLQPYLYINRIREVREIDVAKVYIDELEILGNFVEFELKEEYEFKDLDEYLKRIGKEEDYEDLSFVRKLVKITTDGYKVIKSKMKQSEVLSQKDIKCPICNSNKIALMKGNGEEIIGCDIIAIICHDCEKIFEFSDIKYKNVGGNDDRKSFN